MVTRKSVPEIALEGVGKRFRDGAVALDGISLNVERGEFVTFLGPSGCGKSTLLRLVSGLSLASAGTVAVNGITPKNARAMMSFIFQDATLLPWRTVEENVGLELELEHAAREVRQERVAKMLEVVGLGDVAKRYPRQLSGGMKMRASIARALVTRPRILLMDEPFAALDAQNRVILQAELVRLWEQTGKTVIYVTHSIEEALLMGDRTVIMTAQPGRIKQIIDVPFPHPRDLLQLSASAEFGKLKLDIWRVLEEEVNRARAEMEK
jgi:NitT/TauT family transport system ATP-binding protein